jgi:two-component sensor histidine kinase
MLTAIFLFTYRYAPKSKVKNLFLLLIVVFSVWQVDIVGFRIAPNVEWLHEWRRFPRLATMILAPVTLWFVLVFKNLKRPVLLTLTWIIGIGFALYRFINYRIDTYTYLEYFWMQQNDMLTLSWFVFSFGILFYTLYLLGFKKGSYYKNDNSKLILFGLGFWVFFNLDFFTLLFGLRSLFIGNLATVFFCVIILFALTKRDLFGVKVAISKGASQILVVVIFFGLFFSIKTFLNSNTFLILLLLSIAAFYGEKLRLFFQTSLEKAFISGYYRPAAVVESLSRRLMVAESKVTAISSTINVLKTKMEITNTKYFQALDDDVKENTSYIVEIGGPNSPHGYLALGGKLNEEPFSSQDILVLSTISNQLSTVLERIAKQELVSVYMDKAQRLAIISDSLKAYSHEIRTPLAVLKGEMDVFDMELDSIEDLRVCVNKQIKRMEGIITSTLELSVNTEIDALTEISLNKVVMDLAEFFVSKVISLEYELNDCEMISGNPTELRLLIDNLVKNAMDALENYNDGVIVVKTWQENNNVYLSVKDNGPGMPKEMLNRIWDPFVSGHANSVGRGLGLSKVYSVVVMHNGNIEVESEVGLGAEFTVEFPLTN